MNSYRLNDCDDCERARREYNAAVANGYIGRAIALRRALEAFERRHR